MSDPVGARKSVIYVSGKDVLLGVDQSPSDQEARWTG
jgi:hypothetical protein